MTTQVKPGAKLDIPSVGIEYLDNNRDCVVAMTAVVLSTIYNRTHRYSNLEGQYQIGSLGFTLANGEIFWEYGDGEVNKPTMPEQDDWYTWFTENTTGLIYLIIHKRMLRGLHLVKGTITKFDTHLVVEGKTIAECAELGIHLRPFAQHVTDALIDDVYQKNNVEHFVKLIEDGNVDQITTNVKIRKCNLESCGKLYSVKRYETEFDCECDCECEFDCSL